MTVNGSGDRENHLALHEFVTGLSFDSENGQGEREKASEKAFR